MPFLATKTASVRFDPMANPPGTALYCLEDHYAVVSDRFTLPHIVGRKLLERSHCPAMKDAKQYFAPRSQSDGTSSGGQLLTRNASSKRHKLRDLSAQRRLQMPRPVNPGWKTGIP